MAALKCVTVVEWDAMFAPLKNPTPDDLASLALSQLYGYDALLKSDHVAADVLAADRQTLINFSTALMHKVAHDMAASLATHMQRRMLDFPEGGMQ